MATVRVELFSICAVDLAYHIFSVCAVDLAYHIKHQNS